MAAEAEERISSNRFYCEKCKSCTEHDLTGLLNPQCLRCKALGRTLSESVIKQPESRKKSEP